MLMHYKIKDLKLLISNNQMRELSFIFEKMKQESTIQSNSFHHLQLVARWEIATALENLHYKIMNRPAELFPMRSAKNPQKQKASNCNALYAWNCWFSLNYLQCWWKSPSAPWSTFKPPIQLSWLHHLCKQNHISSSLQHQRNEQQHLQVFAQAHHAQD